MLAVIDCRAPSQAQQALREAGFDLLPLPPHPSLATPVASHPDMLLFFLPDAVCCTEDYAALAASELRLLCATAQKPLRIIQNSPSAIYPHDVLLNAALVGDRLFCLESHTAKELITHPSYHLCPVRQGYAKCSVLPVGQHAMITADTSIAKAAVKAGIDVLLLQEQGTSLTGYPTGFFGGATSFSPYNDRNEILFCGELDLHPEALAIRSFCHSHGKDCRSLGSFPLTDVGTIFLI